MTKIEILTKIEMFRRTLGFFENFDQTWNFHRFWPKSKFFENFDQYLHPPEIWNFDKDLRFFQHFDINRDILKILTKIEIFQKFWPQSRYFDNFNWNRVLKNIDQNPDFSKIFTKICIFKHFDQIRNFQKFDPNRSFSKILTIIEIWDIFLPKFGFFGNFDQNRDFSIFFLPKSRLFETLDQNGDFSINRDLKKNDQTWNCHKFWPKSLFYENLEHNWGIL